MTPLFGLVFAILATVLCWAAVTVTRAARGWLDARALRRRGDGDTVEIVRRRPLVDMAGHMVLVLMLAVPAAVLAGGGALPGPSGGGGGGLPTTGGTMTGALVFDDGLGGPSTSITTGTGNDLNIATAGTRKVKVTSGDTTADTADWVDDAFCWTDNPATGGVRIRLNNLEFTNSAFSAYAAGTITGTALTLTGAGSHHITSTAGSVSLTAAGGIYMASDTNLSGRIRWSTNSPSFTGTQNDYAGCNAYVQCRLTGSSTPILNGMSGMALAEQRILCNVGAADIVIAHEAAGSTAANRFDLVGSVNYTLVQKSCRTFIYDATSARWRASL